MGAAAHLQYNFDGASNGARRPRTIPDAPTQPPLLLSSLPLALSSRVRRMPLSARTCDWVIARPAERVRPMANLHTTAAAAITAFGGLSTACHGRPSEVRRACEKSNRRNAIVTNMGDTYEIAYPVGVMGSDPRLSQRVFQLNTEVPSAKSRTEKAFCGGPYQRLPVGRARVSNVLATLVHLRMNFNTHWATFLEILSRTDFRFPNFAKRLVPLPRSHRIHPPGR